MVRDAETNSTFTVHREIATVAWIIALFTAPITSGKTSTSTRSRISPHGAVGNSSAVVRPCYLMGAQASAWLWAKRPETVEEMFDYKERSGSVSPSGTRSRNALWFGCL